MIVTVIFPKKWIHFSVTNFRKFCNKVNKGCLLQKFTLRHFPFVSSLSFALTGSRLSPISGKNHRLLNWKNPVSDPSTSGIETNLDRPRKIFYKELSFHNCQEVLFPLFPGLSCPDDAWWKTFFLGKKSFFLKNLKNF